MFSRRSPDDIKSPDADRDIFNEKPSKEDIISATEGQGTIIFTSLLSQVFIGGANNLPFSFTVLFHIKILLKKLSDAVLSCIQSIT